MEDFELRAERFREEVLRLQNEYGVELDVGHGCFRDIDILLIEDKKTKESTLF